jgi:hypothetical protein
MRSSAPFSLECRLTRESDFRLGRAQHSATPIRGDAVWRRSAASHQPSCADFVAASVQILLSLDTAATLSQWTMPFQRGATNARASMVAFRGFSPTRRTAYGHQALPYGR